MQPKTNAVFLANLLTGVCVVLGCGQRSDYQPREVPTMVSTQLSKTAIVPTLDTPLGESGSAVWCATFQAAWRRACDDVIGGPLRVAGAQPVADRLNGSPVTEAALPPGNYYATAGRLEDGIVETIRKQMARQFPGVRPPDFAEAVGFVAYGYLDTKVRFTKPFVDTKQPIEFSDAAGVKHSVRGFGPHEGTDWDLRTEQADQVKVLFSQMDDKSERGTLTAFALDLTADQAEQQVIVAVLPRAKHLRAALDDLTRRIEEFTSDQHWAKLQEIDVLAVPNVVFDVEHEFAELQGNDKRIENPGKYQGLPFRAYQSVRFRLDKSGATVISESHTYPAAIPRLFIVNRPFLIVMKRRSAEQPYFVAWIDNVELLEVSEAKGDGS
jgi:hypothetical protein